MDQFIQIQRLGKIMRKFWFENCRTLFLLFAAVAAFLTIWLGLYYNFDNPVLFTTRFQVAYYFVGLFISGLLSASFLFSDLMSKPRAIVYLMLPASHLEKFICILFYGVLIFWAGYSCVFTIVDSIFVALSNAKYEETEAVINVLAIDQYKNPFLDQAPSILYYLYFTVHALFLLGSIYFFRFAFFKTLIILGGIWILFFAAPIIILGFLPPGAWVSSVATYEVYNFRGNVVLNLPLWFTFILTNVFGYLITLLLWAAAYFRLTERQVA